MQPKGPAVGPADRRCQPQDAGRAVPDSFVGRVLLVLSEIASDEDAAPLSLSDLTRRTQLPKTTVHRLLGILESNGAVERINAGYQAGTVMHRLTSRIERDEALRRILMPQLIDLYLRLRQAVSLGVLRGGRVAYLEIFEDAHRQFGSLTDLSGPAHATASGKLLLAFRPALAARYGLDLPLSAFTGRTITTAAGLAAELARIRREGIAFNIEEHIAESVAVAGPVLGHHRTPIAAVAVTGHRSRLDVAAAAWQVRLTCAAASAALALAAPVCPQGERRPDPK